MSTLRLTIIVFFVCLLSSCGKKQKDIFRFNQKKTLKVNKLSLPNIKNANVKVEGRQRIITWSPLYDTYATTNYGKQNAVIVGYNVYPLTRTATIAKNPLNKTPLPKSLFIHTVDTYTKNVSSYTIRGVFKVDGHLIQGPASSIIHVQK